MTNMNLLLFSNSTNAGEEYLTYPLPYIKNFLKNIKSKNIAFIPYAAVTFSFDEYEEHVNNRLNTIGYSVKSVHHSDNPADQIKKADIIIIGGGNTFHLLTHLYKNDLLKAIREKVLNGTPYIGWSAGSNVACPTICTTNDMPVIQPPSFDALNLIPFQINPHYIDANPEGHAGETREQRILEFLAANNEKTVVGLREGTLLHIENNRIELKGKKPARIFKYKQTPIEIDAGKDLHL
jgi:dipeptidase E